MAQLFWCVTRPRPAASQALRRPVARLWWALPLLLWVAAPGVGQAQTPSSSANPTLPRSSEALPTKRRLDPVSLAEKRESGYFTGVPLVNSEPDKGVGLGARVYYYQNGRRADPLFEYTPYLHRAFLQTFLTTNGFQAHQIEYDAPYLGRTLLRLRAQLQFERNTAANYFGRGAATLGRLAFPGSPDGFSNSGDYTEALRAVQPNGTTYSRYDQYIITRPLLRASVERDWLGGAVRLLAGLSLSHVTIRDYTGVSVDAGDGTKAPEALTRLRSDCLERRILGCNDGWDNLLKLGIVYDTRDFEPDPTSGVFADATAEFSTKAFGSRYTYGRVTVAPRVFLGVLRGSPPARLVLSARAVYSVQFGDVPFYDMGTLAFSDGDQVGLGGLRTLRGYKDERFVGAVAAFANVELRWAFLDFSLLRQRFHLVAVPFLDVGRVFDRVGNTTLAGWKRGQGGALRVVWNQATIVSCDYGISSEGPGLYVNFGHQF